MLVSDQTCRRGGKRISSSLTTLVVEADGIRDTGGTKMAVGREERTRKARGGLRDARHCYGVQASLLPGTTGPGWAGRDEENQTGNNLELKEYDLRVCIFEAIHSGCPGLSGRARAGKA